MKPQQVCVALPQEKQAVRKYAPGYPEIRHRELRWRVLDDDVVALSSSSVYRILPEQDLMQGQCPLKQIRSRFDYENEYAQKTGSTGSLRLPASRRN